MSRNCVMCDKEIDLNQDAYVSGESLGEYWCEECTNRKVNNGEGEMNKIRRKLDVVKGELEVALKEIKSLKQENQWLYGKLNQISSVIEKGREESKKF